MKTPGEAETWALLFLLRELVAIPSTTTDCLGVLRMAAAGMKRATDGNSQQARTWNAILQCTGGELCELAKSLRWMPAHVAAHNFRARTDSVGRCLTTVDWRANQLSDTLAKLGGAYIRPPPQG